MFTQSAPQKVRAEPPKLYRCPSNMKYYGWRILLNIENGRCFPPVGRVSWRESRRTEDARRRVEAPSKCDNRLCRLPGPVTNDHQLENWNRCVLKSTKLAPSTCPWLSAHALLLRWTRWEGAVTTHTSSRSSRPVWTRPIRNGTETAWWEPTEPTGSCRNRILKVFLYPGWKIPIISLYETVDWRRPIPW